MFRAKHANIVVSLVIMLSLLLVGFNAAQAATPGKGLKAAKIPAANACAKSKRIKAKGQVRFSDWQFPDTFNVYQAGGLLVTRLNQENVIEGYWRYNNKGAMFPLMLTRLPSIKNKDIQQGGKLVTIHLKKGLRWSNGAEITSADIKFGWKVDSNKATGPACTGSCDIISRLDTPNKYTVVFHNKAIDAGFLENDLPSFWPLAWPGGWSKGDVNGAATKLGQDKSFNFEGPNYPTNGPYQVSQWVANDRIVYTPMKYYNNLSCGANVATLIFAFYSSKPGLEAAAATRDTDTTTDYTWPDVNDLKKHTDVYKLSVIPAFAFEHLEFNTDAQFNGAANPVSNVKVRQALALALDKRGLIASALGMTPTEVNTFIAWTWLLNTPKLVQPFADKAIKGQWDPLQKKYDANPGTGKALADAKTLLTQAGFPNGFPVELWTTAGNPVRQAQVAVISASWEKVGVKVNANYTTPTKMFDGYVNGGIITTGKFQVGMWGYSGSPAVSGWKYNQQSRYIEREQSVHPCPTCSNNAGIHDPLIDKAWNKFSGTLDKKTQTLQMNAIQVQMNQMAYWIPLYYRVNVDTNNGQVAKNWLPNPTSYGAEWNSVQWRAKS